MCAFLSMDSLEGFVCDDHLLFTPLAEKGWQVDVIGWRNSRVKWNQYQAVIIRSTWDYDLHPALFLSRLQEIADSGTRLENDFSLVRWNWQKTYLRDLEKQGTVIVPTLWLRSPDLKHIRNSFTHLHAEEIVLKPVIGANAKDTFRLAAGVSDNRLQEASEVFMARDVMVQPFIRSIIEEGEFSLFYFGGAYSHAILKTPAVDDFRVQEEHGGRITAVRPEAALLALATRTIAKIAPLPLYARLDFVRLKTGNFALMELELIEPSLYLRMHKEAPLNFANAFINRMSQ